MYHVWTIYNDGHEEDKILVTDELAEAVQAARDEASNIERFEHGHGDVEIRTYVDEEECDYNPIEFRLWYAVMADKLDSDWGYGSRNLKEAERMVRNLRDEGYEDAYIAVIDDAMNPNDPVCIDEIRDE